METENRTNGTEERGVIITLVPRNAQLHFQEAIDAPFVRNISMHLELDRGEDVRLPGNRSLNELRLTMALVEGSEYNEEATKNGAIGFVSHFAGSVGIDDYSPELCHIGCALKPEKFVTLLAAFQNGRLPDQIHVTVRGMSYGGAPDGSVKVWDIKNRPHLSVIGMQFNIPLIANPESSADLNDEFVKFDRLPATSGDIRAMEQKLVVGLVELRRDAQKWRMGLGCLLIVATAILYFWS